MLDPKKNSEPKTKRSDRFHVSSYIMKYLDSPSHLPSINICSSLEECLGFVRKRIYTFL